MQSAQAQHLQQWVNERTIEEKQILTEEQVVDNLIQWMDRVGRVVMHLAFVFGILMVVVQLWMWFH